MWIRLAKFFYPNLFQMMMIGHHTDGKLPLLHRSQHHQVHHHTEDGDDEGGSDFYGDGEGDERWQEV